MTPHQQKRVRQYFNLIKFRDHDQHIDKRDIDNAINWSIKRYDSVRGDRLRIDKREYLLNCVREIGGPAEDDIAQFTENQWFASLPMWRNMQEKIADYNNWLQIQNPSLVRRLPKIRNLCIIHICCHLRKPVRIESDVLYRMMCETKMIPRKDGKQVDQTYISQNREFYFNLIFNMISTNRFLKANKEFHHSIVSDGVTASILYKVPKRVSSG